MHKPSAFCVIGSQIQRRPRADACPPGGWSLFGEAVFHAADHKGLPNLCLQTA